MKLEVPSECSLAQAALFVAEKLPPVDEEWYQAAARPIIDMPANLIYALKSKQLIATGSLYRRYRQYLEFPLIESEILANYRDVPIPSSFWNIELVNAARSQLEADDWIASAEYNDNSLLDKSGGQLVLVFAGIKVSTSVLFHLFGPNEIGVGSGRPPGRPRHYDWDEFYIEIAVRADLDKLPETQAELEDEMAQWCLQEWKKQPSELTLRGKIAPIYRHRRKAGK